jgi:gamma-glutamyltranspeptidase/glutathione hydrolase
VNARRIAIIVVAAVLAVVAPLAAESGAVASAAPAASAAGISVLAAGGNAVDAAVATALALAVVHPQAGNLGGGGFAVVRVRGELAALDFRETAPRGASRNMYVDASGQVVPERSQVGPLAAGVPGSPTGLYELHRRFGALPWRRVVEPARRLALDGFEVTPRLSRALTDERQLLSRFADTAAVWLPGDSPPAAGTRVRLPRLAGLLARYARSGPQAVTSGAGGRAIERACRAHGGILTTADLAGYRPIWREPIRWDAFGWQVASMPLPSSGGVILAQACGMLERCGYARAPAGSTDRAHLLVEVLKRAYADRFLLGDPASTTVQIARLLDTVWLDTRAAGISGKMATPSTEVGPYPGSAAAEHRETTHLSVIDSEGNAVALTTTLNGSFGCGLLVPELGILLNNEMDDFASRVGAPNLYGLVQGEANAIAPGKRMLSSMAPTIATREGETIVLGSPGGSRIPTAVLQVFLAKAVDGRSLAEAVNAPRVHHQWLPDELVYEDGALTDPVRAGLVERGHRLRRERKLGEVHAVRRAADGQIEAAADARGPGTGAVTPGLETGPPRPLR